MTDNIEPRNPSRNRLLADIAESADALTDSRQHRESRHGWDHNRHRQELADHITVIPGLIQQLRDLAEPGTGEEGPGARSIPDSRPPVDLDAVSLLHAIEYGAAKRVLDLGLAVRDSAESNLRAIVGAASQQSSDVQQSIAREVRSWHMQAEVICRWRTGAVDLRSPCPATVLDPRTGSERQCGARTVVANADTYAAWCVTCGAEWSPDEFEDLCKRLRDYHDRSRADADAVRAEVRARKLAATEAERAVRERVAAEKDAA